MKRLVVIGGSDAGISAALRAREVDPSWGVTLICADAFPNFSICGLPFFLSGETPRWESLAHRTRVDIESRGIELWLDCVAEGIDPVAHRISVITEDRGLQSLSYERLVIATGAVPAPRPIAGLDMPGVYPLDTMAESLAVHEHLESRAPRRAVIVGGGYIGVEMADALRHRGLPVTLLEAGSSVLQSVDPEFGARVRDELARREVDVRTSARVESIERAGSGLLVRGAGLDPIETDLVLVVTGVRPNVALATSAGVAQGVRGALRVTRRMETNFPDVFAAGDCVETHHRMLSEPTYIPLGTTAHKQGRIAGENAVGGSAVFQGSLGTQVVKVFDLVIGRTGLRDSEATRAGLAPVTRETVAWDHKSYYPGASELRIRTTGDARTGRMLGAQLLGRYGSEVSKRLDVFALALFHDARVDALEHVDLSYTPPLASPWDAVQMATMEWTLHTPKAQQGGGYA
jgi:NADPH-dependent 2,4-dienoyl-CoA reductase/sulfur reductase-like enzyme